MAGPLTLQGASKGLANWRAGDMAALQPMV